MSASHGHYLAIKNLPGKWQFWGEAEEPYYWLAPADEAAHAVVLAQRGNAEVRIRSGFALAPRDCFDVLPLTGDLLLF